MTGRRGGYVLFSLVYAETLHRVNRRVAQQLQRIPAADVEIHHMMRLVEQYRAMLPSPLLGAPIVEFRRDHGIYIGPQLRIAKQFHGIARCRQNLFEIARRHEYSPPLK